MKAMKKRSKIRNILSGEREEIRRRLENEKGAKIRIRLILLNLVASGLAVEEAAVRDETADCVCVDRPMDKERLWDYYRRKGAEDRLSWIRSRKKN